MSQPFFPVITLSGGAFERGRQHGDRAKEKIGVALETYLRAFQRQAGLDREQVRRAARRFIPAIEQFDAELLAELEGIAEGSAWGLEEIVALNSRNELLFAVQPECTSFVVLPEASASHHVLLGQNLDWKVSATASGVVLEILQEDEGRPNVATVTEAGTLGRTGLNAAGLGLCNNFLNSRGSDTKQLGWVGVPTQLLRRKMLNAWTFTDAVAALYGSTRCMATNYLLAHREGVALDFETAPEGIAHLEPADGLLTHANHFVSQWGRPIDTGIVATPSTLWRGSRVEHLLRPHVGHLDVELLQSVLRDHANYPGSLCRHGDPREVEAARTETSVSIIMDLTDRKVWMTAGPPCESDYVELEFESLRREPGSTFWDTARR